MVLSLWWWSPIAVGVVRCFRLVVMRIFALVLVEMHLPVRIPLLEIFQVRLKLVGISLCSDGSIHEANSPALELTLEGRSLMYTRNKSGPRTVWPSTSKLWVLVDRELLVQLSNAFEKSSSTASILVLNSMSMERSWIVVITWNSQGRFFLNPCW